MSINIYPLEKVVVNGISICFGMEKSIVETAIGNSKQIGNRHYYFNNEMAIDYRQNKVDFIEFLGGVDGSLKPVLYGLSVFDIPSNDLINVLKEENGGEICDTERGYSYQFSNIGISVYREATPEDIKGMIKEAESFGNLMSTEEIEHETKRANYFATIGVSVKGYYSR